MYAFEMYEMGRDATPIERMIEKLRAGDLSTLARTITLIEHRAPEWIPLLRALFPFTGHAQTIGITGAPGSGKSTLAGQAIRAYRQRDKSVGVIAVDPTSPYSGGATLGDRIRMQSAADDPGVFIRSMASRGQLGGLAPTTADVATVLDASGRDRILIETVGVGQDQLDVVSVADVVIVLLVPGMGDDVQAAKAGIMEAADVFAVNKADRSGAEQTERALHDSLSLNRRADGWTPPVVRTVATTGEGVRDLISAVDAYFEFLRKNNLRRRKAIEKWQTRLLRILQERLAERLLNPEFGPLFLSYARAVADHELDPYTVVERLLGGPVDQSRQPEVVRRRA